VPAARAEENGRPLDDAEIAALLAPCEDFPHLALAVSGGPDSTALMLLASRWRRQMKSGPRLSVLTVDHGLRPEAAEEAALVCRQAKRLGLSCEILRWRPSSDMAGGLQARARAARYRLMGEWCHAREAALVTAHALEDQAETVLMRLMRGSGVDGLSGMAPVGHVPHMPEGMPPPPLLRPLLGVSRSRLRASIAAAGLEWVEDPSNRDTGFERVRLRQAWETLAALGLSPHAVALSARRLRRAREALEGWLEDFLGRHLKTHALLWGEVPLGALCELPDEMALRALRALTVAFGNAREHPPRLEDLERLLHWTRSLCHGANAGGRTLGGAFLKARGGRLLVTREAGRIRHELLLSPAVPEGIWDGRVRLRLRGLRENVHVLPLAAAESSTNAMPADERPPRRPRRTPVMAWAAQPAIFWRSRLVALPLSRWQAADAPWQALDFQPLVALPPATNDGED
jgi:tRNA(Ile)-lysidine synthase